MMDINGILKILPHRFPFLLLDRILVCENKKRAVGIKNVTVNEPYFQGHFPDNPIMPGVLILESVAQLGGIMILKDYGDKNIVPYLAGVDKVKFRKPVVPGDQLYMETNVIAVRGNMGKVKGVAKVDNEIVFEGEILFAIVEEEKQ